MKDAEITVDEVAEVALIGDFTRTPMIINMINEMFQGRSIRHLDHNSHFLAAHGAALESAVV